MDEDDELEDLDEVELEAEAIEELPDREALSLVDPLGDSLGPPPLDDPALPPPPPDQ